MGGSRESDAVPRRDFVVGVDLGGTGSRFVAMTTNGTILARRGVATPTTLDADSSVQFFREQVRELILATNAEGAEYGGLVAASGGDRAARQALSSDETLPFIGIGIGASGPIDSDGIIQNPDTLAAFSGYDLVGALTETFGIPCAIDNDAVTAAIAEARFGSVRESEKPLLHVTLGTGIGVCLLEDGRPFRGADGQHPEAGHISVSGAAAPCYCGRTACWEQKASRTALQHAAAAATGSSFGDLRDIEEAVRQADKAVPAALELFNDYGRCLAEGLGTLLGVYGASQVVLGGSVAQYFAHYEGPVSAALHELYGWIPEYTLAPTGLDDFGGALGAGLLVLAQTGE